MSGLHLQEFLALLKKSDLLSPPQWETAQRIVRAVKSAATPDDQESGRASKVAAAELVKQDLLTEWQATQLLKGQTGFVLQQYRLLAPVGKGGMGHVFKARDDRSGAIVAIKVMSRHLTFNQTLVNRFRREIKASSLLNSPHIVRTLDAGRVGKVDFMVMEYVNGDQLDRVASRLNAMPAGLACEIVRQAAIGLQHAHEQKMVHRDIKPANLIVDWAADGMGTVKVMDMGLVRLSDTSDEQTTVTKAGQVMGTPDYMSPEQGWNTASVDIRSDIYSLGCTLFRLLTGRIPFPGDNPLQVLMARCSRDAPTARSVRGDIPESVEAVLRRMTLRDPVGRFHSPQEVIDALTPLCTPLTIEALRDAVREAGNDDAVLLEVAPAKDADFAQDAGYQQFLREVYSGAEVDLMTSATPDNGFALETTLPLLTSGERTLTADRRKGARSERKAALMGFGTVIAAIALAALFLWINRDQDSEKLTTSESDKSGRPVIELPTAQLAPVPAQSVAVGESLTWQLVFDGDPPRTPAGSELAFRLGNGAPASVSIDRQTGSVSWPVPRGTTPEDYAIPVELVFLSDGRSSVIASTSLAVTVLPEPKAVSIARLERLWVRTGETATTVVTTNLPLDPSSSVILRLAPITPSAMSLNSATGEFSWTPTEDDAGPHTVAVQLFDAASNAVVAESQLIINVMFIPNLPEQSATAGERFSLTIPRPRRIASRLLPLLLVPGGPPGVGFDQRTGVVTWNVPTDADGRHEIRLRLDLPPRELRQRMIEPPELLIVVNVSRSAPRSLIPDASAVEAAKAELRELYKREFAVARTPADRAALARQLLERSYDQTTGASDFAALDLVLEQADRARALDVALEAIQLRAARYGTNERAEAAPFVAEFRVLSLSPAQHDSVVEHCVRLALAAANDSQFEETAALLTPPDAIARKSDRAVAGDQFTSDIATALGLAKELSEDNVATADIKTTELRRLLQQWQFRPLFTTPDSFNFFQAQTVGVSTTARPDGGRGLWTFESERLRVAASGSLAGVGFLEQARNTDRCLIRMQLSARTTSAVFVFAGSLNQPLNASALVLDGSTFGLIRDLPSLNVVHQPSQPVVLPTEGWNDIEVMLDGPRVIVRLDGTQVINTTLAAARSGRLGLFAALEQNRPDHLLDIRHPRILVIPE